MTVNLFRRYSRSKSKVVSNRAEFWTLFRPPKFYGVGLPKVIPMLSPLPHDVGVCRLEKFREVTPTKPEVIGAHTLTFRPNFKLSRFIGMCASKPWLLSSAHKKIEGAAPTKGRNNK